MVRWFENLSKESTNEQRKQDNLQRSCLAGNKRKLAGESKSRYEEQLRALKAEETK